MNKMISNADRATILVEALPYIQNYNGKIMVIKYGGNAMQSDELRNSVMRDIVLMQLVGIKVVLVHGGGPEISEELEKRGKKSQFIDGVRVTDEETMDVVSMVLAGKINKSLVNIINSVGGRAMGICGADGGMIKAGKLSEEYGFVGNITEIETSPILDLLNNGYIPVISTIACDDDGNFYNINADTAAAKIAGALHAQSLISLTNITGILHNPKDEDTLIPVIHTSEAQKYFDEGIISGGMIPKIQACIEAIEEGAEKVFIIDGRVPHSILIEVFTDEGIGTMFTR